MERIHTLIDKLSQQKAQNAPPAHLLFTVQLLQQELLQLQTQSGSTAARKVAVTLPKNLNFSEESLRVPFTEAANDKQVFVLDEIVEAEPELPPVAEPAPQPKPYVLQKPTFADAPLSEPEAFAPVVRRDEQQPSYNRAAYFNTALEVVPETPTLPAAERKELHHVLAEKKESLNDRLKEQRTEVAHLLKETPIKDLRKGIGINDRFAFVRELFRGDEAAYERSVKTINGFNIYSEAEYWIARELKHKMGWDERNETVAHFYALVRRRFS